MLNLLQTFSSHVPLLFLPCRITNSDQLYLKQTRDAFHSCPLSTSLTIIFRLDYYNPSPSGPLAELHANVTCSGKLPQTLTPTTGLTTSQNTSPCYFWSCWKVSSLRAETLSLFSFTSLSVWHRPWNKVHIQY